MKKKVVFTLMGILTAIVIYNTDLIGMFQNIGEHTKQISAFAIVSFAAAYAYYLIDLVFSKQQSDGYF